MKMKNLKLFLTIIFIGLTVKYPFAGLSDKDGIKKSYHQDYSCSKSSKLVIENKYGEVNILNWDKDAVSIDVTIIVETTKPEKAQKVFSKISIDFSKEDDVLKAITTIDGEFSKIYFSINYKVNMPVWLQIDIINKFGNVIIDEAHGLVNLNVEYGNLDANKLLNDESKPMSNIILSYSKGELEQCGWIKLTLKYSELNINKAKAVILISRYSQFEATTANSLVCVSKYDTYELGTVSNFVFIGEFTNGEVDKVIKTIDLDLKYGSMEIKEVLPDFDSIKIKDKFGNAEIGISETASYKLNANLKYCEFELPETVIKKLSVIKEGGKKSVSGFVGKNKATDSTVDIESEYGNIEL